MKKKALTLNNIEFTTDKNDLDYDILHINTIYPDSISMIKQARENNKKIIYHAHSTEEDFKNSFMFSNSFAGLYKKWLVYLYNSADVIITPTPYSKSLLESYDLNKEIYPISNGVDVAQFNPTSKQINEFTQQFHISEEDKLVISVGWLFERKGFDTFVEVAREMPRVKFMWFGDVRLSNPTSKIKKLLKELPENLILPGYVSGDIIKGAYGRADVFFFPSREETEGIVVLEALASFSSITFTLETCIGASISNIPPLSFILVGLLCFLTICTPSTTTLASVFNVLITLPVLPLSAPAITLTVSPTFTFIFASYNTSEARETIFI